MAGKGDSVQTIIRNLNKEIGKIEGNIMGGLLEAGYLILATSNHHVPREHSNLFAGGYARKAMEDTNPGVEIGYIADYAVYVHENLQQKLKGQPRPSGLGVYWGPQGTPKFLTNSLVKHAPEIPNIIAKRAKIK